MPPKSMQSPALIEIGKNQRPFYYDKVNNIITNNHVDNASIASEYFTNINAPNTACNSAHSNTILGDRFPTKMKVDTQSQSIEDDMTMPIVSEILSPKKHIRSEMTQTVSGKFLCTIPTCLMTFSRKAHLERHINRRHKEKEGLICMLCNINFSTAHDLELHRTNLNHSKLENVQTRFHCKYDNCGRSYTRKDHLTRHQSVAHNSCVESAESLNSCSERNGDSISLQTDEKKSEIASTNYKAFRCTMCEATFSYSHGLTRHYRRSHHHDSVHPYKCNICLLVFKKKTALQAHTYIHTGVPPFACKVCGATYLKKFQLTKHERKHLLSDEAASVSGLSTPKVYCCSIDSCCKVLLTHEEKIEHEKEHDARVQVRKRKVSSLEGTEANVKNRSIEEGEKQYNANNIECDVCGSVFKYKKNLRAHIRLHYTTVDERKLLRCPIPPCDKTFTTTSNCKAHIQASHAVAGDNTLLLKNPSTPSQAIHNSNHNIQNDVVGFRCNINGCCARFRYKHSLKVHQQNIHTNGDARQAVKRRCLRKSTSKGIDVKTRIFGT